MGFHYSVTLIIEKQNIYLKGKQNQLARCMRQSQFHLLQRMEYELDFLRTYIDVANAKVLEIMLKIIIVQSYLIEFDKS